MLLSQALDTWSIMLLKMVHLKIVSLGGVTRTTYWSGDVGVVTENNGNLVVTILRRSGQ